LSPGGIPFRRQSRKQGNRKRNHSTVVAARLSLRLWPDDNTLIILSFCKFSKWFGRRRPRVRFAKTARRRPLGFVPPKRVLRFVPL